ncbi:MAG: hypothetical protein WA213_18900 [Terriglobales bacterium]
MQQALAKLTHSKMQHWSAGNPVRMVRAISFDFIAQLETRIEEIPGFNNKELAKRLGVSLGRVSQVMNSPGNFTIRNAALYANAVDRNVTIVMYPLDPNGDQAPISGDVFRACWDIAGRPKNMFEIHDSSLGFATQNGCYGMAIGHAWNYTAQTDYRRQLIACVPLEIPTMGSKGATDNNA